MGWINRILGKSFVRNNKSRKPIKKTTRLCLEALEARVVPVSAIGAVEVPYNLASATGKFAANMDTLTTDNENFVAGANTLSGHLQLTFDISSTAGGITATVGGTGDMDGKAVHFTPSGTAHASVTGNSFSGTFDWSATTDDTPAENVQGYGLLFGTVDGSGTITNGRCFTEFYSDRPATGIYTWTGGGNGKWSDKNDWSLNGKTPGAAPGSNQIVKFNGSNNASVEVDSSITPWAVAIENGYSGTFTIDSGKTFTPTYYIDSFNGSNKFVVSFQDNTATLVMGRSGDLSNPQMLQNFKWNSGGNVTLQGAVQIGYNSGLSCYCESPITTGAACSIYTGGWQYNIVGGSSTFHLDNNSAILTLSNGGTGSAIWEDFQGKGTTDITSDGNTSYVGVTAKGAAIFLNPNAYASTDASTIGIQVIENSSTANVYFGSETATYNASATGAYMKFTQNGGLSNPYDLVLASGTMFLNNANILTMTDGFDQTGGTFWVNDTTNETIKASSALSSKVIFEGGVLKFNNSLGVAGAYGTLTVNGLVTVESNDVYMAIKGSTGGDGNENAIIDPDTTADFTLNNSSTLHITVDGTKTTHPLWHIVRLATGQSFKGSKQFGLGTGLPSGYTQDTSDARYIGIQG